VGSFGVSSQGKENCNRALLTGDLLACAGAAGPTYEGKPTLGFRRSNETWGDGA